MTDHPAPEYLVNEMMRLHSLISATLDDIQSAFERARPRLSRMTLEEWEGLRNDAVALIYHLQAQDRFSETVRSFRPKARTFERAERLLNRIDKLGLRRWPAAAEAAGAVLVRSA